MNFFSAKPLPAERHLFERVTFSAITRNGESNLLILDSSAGSFYIRAAGDCCSRSYFEDFSGVDALIGSPIQLVREISFPGRRDETSDPDVVTAYYALEIQTGKGVCRIAFRNESNGYYGGYSESGKVIRQPDGAEYCEDEPFDKLDRSAFVAVTDN